MAALRSVLDGVAEQVEENLDEPLPIGPHVDAVGALDAHADGDPPLVGGLGDQADALLEDAANIERLQRHDLAARLDARDVEHVVDQAEQVRPGPLDGVDGGSLVLARLAHLEQVAESEHCRQGRAQLVAHSREVFALGVAGLLGDVASAAQLVGGTFLVADVAVDLEHCQRLALAVALHGPARADLQGSAVLGDLAQLSLPVVVLAERGDDDVERDRVLGLQERRVRHGRSASSWVYPYSWAAAGSRIRCARVSKFQLNTAS